MTPGTHSSLGIERLAALCPRGVFIVAVLLFPLAATAVRGEEPSLGEVTVRAARLPDEAVLEDRTAFASVIDTADKTAEADTVSDVLAETVGVQVRRFGGLGAFSSVSIRGSAANQVQVYIDDIPMNRARNEVVNLATLSLDAVDHIEVYRSFVPISFSRAGPGGAVNIVTKRAGKEPRTVVSGTYGSFDSRKASVERSARHGPWEYLLFGTYSGSEGDFPFRNDNGTPTEINAFDDFDDVRRNNAFNAVDFLAKGGHRFSERSELTFSSQTFYKDEGIPGLAAVQASDTSFEELRSLNHLRAELTGLGVAELDLRATAHVIYDRARFADPLGEIGVGNQDRDDQTIAAGGDALFTYYWGGHQVPGLLLAAGYEEFLPDDRLDPEGAGPDQERIRLTVAAQDEVYLWGERISIVPAVRWEWLRDDFSGDLPPALAGAPEPRQRTERLTSPRLGVRLNLVPFLSILGNIARVDRPPNFTELFGDRGVVAGNADLRSEEAVNRDVGFRFYRRDMGFLNELRLEYAYFDNEIDDLILPLQTSQGVVRPQNVDAARIRGHEVMLSVQVWRHVALSVNYTRQDAEDRSAAPHRRGKRLAGVPEDEAYARAELYGDLGRLYYEVSLIGDNFLSPGEGLDRVPSRNIHGAGVSVRPVGPALTFTLEAKNLTDERTEDFFAFPLPGRSFFGTVRYAF